jgi:HmuY protein
MSFHNLSISVLKVGRQLAGSLAVAAFFMLSLFGCIKEESPVMPRPVDLSLVKSKIPLGTDYRYQAFYNLDKDSMLSRNLKYDWDVAFDVSNTEGVSLHLNSAKFMFASPVTKSNFESLKDTSGFFINRKWDASNRPDSPAIGNIKSFDKLFLIDKGYDALGDPAGFVKIKFEAVNGKKVKFKYANLDETKGTQAEITRTSNANFIYFSFKTGKEVAVEPPKDNWDLQFTQYIHTFTNPYTPYLVTGVLINPFNTSVAVDSTMSFDKVDRVFSENLVFKTSPDVIGYNWKDFVNGTYVTKSKYTYIIKNSKNALFKFRFIDFYDAQGVKGTPRFEFQRLSN